jgi:hypothetical protein
MLTPSPNLAAHGSTTATTFCDFCALLKKNGIKCNKPLKKKME